MTSTRLEELQEAAKIIEMDGDEGYHAVVRRFGRDVADVLLVAHLRRSYGAMESFPPPENVASDTHAHLKRMLLVDD